MSFQGEPEFQAPTWPSSADQQQMQLHLDFQVSDLDSAHRRAVDAGARLMEFQPQPDVVVGLALAGLLGIAYRRRSQSLVP